MNALMMENIVAGTPCHCFFMHASNTADRLTSIISGNTEQATFPQPHVQARELRQTSSSSSHQKQPQHGDGQLQTLSQFDHTLSMATALAHSMHRGGVTRIQ